MIGTTKPPSIIHMPSTKKINNLDWKGDVTEILVGDGRSQDDLYQYNGSNGKKRMKPFNLLRREPDVQNCNGQSVAVTAKDYQPLERYDIGIFMVNLAKGSMMAPHWNPRATEIAIVLQGQGMIRIACSASSSSDVDADECENSRLIGVKVGDVFVVPRFHPMAHLSFNNDSLVFVGFSSMARRNRPQFLAGTRSVFQTMDLHILALSFNLTSATMKHLLAPQKNFVFLDCTSCAEEEEKRKQERSEKQKKEEEERKRKEEEEARKKRQEEEEEERKKKEEEEARKKRQEEEEEEKKKKEEEAKEEARKKQQEEEEEEKKKKEEEEARKKREKEKEEEEEEERGGEAKEAAGGARRQKEEAAATSREREKQRREEEEETKRRAQQKREREKREGKAAAAAAAAAWRRKEEERRGDERVDS